MSRIVTVGGAPVITASGPVTVPSLGDLEPTHGWDALDAVTYTGGSPSTLRADYIPDCGTAGTHPLIRDQGFYGTAFAQPTCDGPLYIPSSTRFRGYPAIVGEAGTVGGQALLASTADPTDSGTWFGGTSGLAQPYIAAVCVRALDGEETSGAWDAQQGSIGTTVSVFHDLAGDDWGATTGVRPGEPWPDTGITQTEQTTLTLIVGVDGTDSFWEFNSQLEGQLAPTTFRDTTFDLADDAPARELFFGWITRACYFGFGAIWAGAFDEDLIDAIRAFGLLRCPPRTVGTPLPAEP